MIADTSDPLRPRLVGAYEFPSDSVERTISAVASSGTWVYVVLGTDGLAVLDTADPTSVVQEAWMEIPGVRDVLVSDGDLIIRAADYVAMLDLTDPLSPELLGRLDVPESGVRAMAAEDRRVYLGATAADPVVRVMDFVEPTEPSELGTYEATWTGHDMAVAEGTVVVSGRYAVRVLDARDPRAIRETHAITTRGHGNGVRIRWGDAIIADGWGGLVTLAGVVPRPELPPRAWLPAIRR
jgi:hypothetical protein